MSHQMVHRWHGEFSESLVILWVVQPKNSRRRKAATFVASTRVLSLYCRLGKQRILLCSLSEYNFDLELKEGSISRESALWSDWTLTHELSQNLSVAMCSHLKLLHSYLADLQRLVCQRHPFWLWQGLIYQGSPPCNSNGSSRSHALRSIIDS